MASNITPEFDRVTRDRPFYHPEKEYKDDVGYNIFCIPESDDISNSGMIEPGTFIKCKTNTKIVKYPNDCYGQIFLRSSLARQGFVVSGGVIDRNYHEELVVYLHYFGENDYEVPIDWMPVQVVFIKAYHEQDSCRPKRPRLE